MRKLTLSLLLVLLALRVSAQPIDPFAPENPVVMGRGGSFTATALGYNSFFSNPAGFAREGELTLAAVNAWAFADRNLVSLVQEIAASSLPVPSGSVSRSIDPAAYEDLQVYLDDLSVWAEATDDATLTLILQNVTGDAGIEFTDEGDLAELLASAGTDDILVFLYALEAEAALQGAALPFTVDDLKAAVEAALPGGRIRVGGQVGLGYVGHGIGLGLFANAEAAIDGSNVLQARGVAYNTITFVGGIGLTFGHLHLGVAVRPTVFGYSRVNVAPIIADYVAGRAPDLTSMFNSTVYYGSGLGVDVGALYQRGPFSIGLAVRDAFDTRIAYRKAGFDEYFQALSGASLPSGSALTESEQDAAFTIPMKINAGFEFHPDLGVLRFLIDPSFSVDLLDVTRISRAWGSGTEVSPEELLGIVNVGAQVDLLRFLSLRAGYYGGFLSAGAGVKVLFFDLNAAIAGDFSRNAAGAWGFNEVGASVELAFRF